MIQSDKERCPLERWLGIQLKYLKREQYRQLSSHHGLARGSREVVTERLEETIVCYGPDSFTTDEVGLIARQLEFIRMHLRDHTKDEQRLALIERCLLGGESPTDIAAEYGTTGTTAASIVSRARKYLQIRLRKPSKITAGKRRRRKSANDTQVPHEQNYASRLKS